MAVANRAHSTTSYLVHTRLPDGHCRFLVDAQGFCEAAGSLRAVASEAGGFVLLQALPRLLCRVVQAGDFGRVQAPLVHGA